MAGSSRENGSMKHLNGENRKSRRYSGGQRRRHYSRCASFISILSHKRSITFLFFVIGIISLVMNITMIIFQTPGDFLDKTSHQNNILGDFLDKTSHQNNILSVSKVMGEERDYPNRHKPGFLRQLKTPIVEETEEESDKEDNDDDNDDGESSDDENEEVLMEEGTEESIVGREILNHDTRTDTMIPATSVGTPLSEDTDYYYDDGITREIQRSEKGPKEWFDLKLRMPSTRNFDESMYRDVNEFAMISEPVDMLLSDKFDDTSLLRPVNLTNDLPYLGVLLDAGRHYFPVEWVKRMIYTLSVMNYNLLHFRLTDDQTFNVKLDSQPLLAYPTTIDNNTQVYSPDELRDIVQYAKKKGIVVIPEINVPGHAASWAGIPELIVQCPKFICDKGYGVPLNVSSPMLRPILKDVMEEIVDIFDKPPYLHLGGDEVHMAQPCFDEVGEHMFDYNEFENMLRSILLEVGYNDSQIIRWEMTHLPPGLTRAGNITHFWFSHLGDDRFEQIYGANYSDPVFLSANLYFDTNEEDSAWEVYVKTKMLKHNLHPKSPTLGVIAGTFELSARYWNDRNVIGKLLAVSLGVSNTNIFERLQFFPQYKKVCDSIGFDDTVCKLHGIASVRYRDFRNELKDGYQSVWKDWIKNVCTRLTKLGYKRTYQNMLHKLPGSISRTKVAQFSKNAFWDSYFKETQRKILDAANITHVVNDDIDLLHGGERLVPNIGIILDIAQYPLTHIERLEQIIRTTMSLFGFNTVQLRLVNDFAFAYHSSLHGQMFYEPPITTSGKNVSVMYPSMEDLLNFRNTAASHGIAIMPEISVSTNAGGAIASSYNVDCPNFLCEYGKYVPQDIRDESYLPVAYSLIQELLKVTSSEYFHLGYDEREASTPCFLEVDQSWRAKQSPNFDLFEYKLKKLLQLAGVTSDKVVRWQNKEKVHYPGRLGDITQCNALDACEFASHSEENDGITSYPWFATVDVRRGGPWQIYSSTYNLASRSPIGIMAQIGGLGITDFREDYMNLRLLAFELGTLKVPHLERLDFEKAFSNTCSKFLMMALNNSKTLKTNQKDPSIFCKEFASTNHDALSLFKFNEEKNIEHLADEICRERTMKVNARAMRNASDIPTINSLLVGISHDQHNHKETVTTPITLDTAEDDDDTDDRTTIKEETEEGNDDDDDVDGGDSGAIGDDDTE